MAAHQLMTSDSFNLLLDEIWQAPPNAKLEKAWAAADKLQTYDAELLEQLMSRTFGPEYQMDLVPNVLLSVQFIRDHMDTPLFSSNREERDKFYEKFASSVGISAGDFWSLYRAWNLIDKR